MPDFMYIAKQPVYGKDNHLFGYELYYRDARKKASLPKDKREATAAVLVNALNQTGLDNLVGSAMAFVNIDSTILLTDLIYTMPKDRFVFELNEDIKINQKELECIKELHKEGYLLALDNAYFGPEYLKNISSTLPFIDYIKFDTTCTDYELLEKDLPLYAGKKLVAQKIESKRIYHTYKKLGFDYFQGFYLAKPELIKKNRIDPHHMGVTHLFDLLQSSNSMQEIYQEFQQHNEIMLQLLQFINSGGFHFDSTSTTICDVLDFIGKKALSQWLMLIVFAKSGHYDETHVNPTSLIAHNRIDLMLGILRHIGQKDEKIIAQVRYAALLSLQETIFEMSLPSVLDKLGVDKIIRDALLYKSGELGHLYALTLALENSHHKEAEKLLQKYGLTLEDIWGILEEHCGMQRL